MSSYRLVVGAGGLALLMALTVPVAGAAIPVEDMSTRPETDSAGVGASVNGTAVGLPDTPTGAGSIAAAPRPGQLSQLFYEIQQLQQEVQQLRGQLEDQTYQLERLRQLQRQQYLDIDRRLAAAAAASVVTPAGTVQPAPIVAPAPSARSTVAAATTASAPALPAPSEKSSYTAAFELMKNQQFGDSIAAFQALLRGYPQGAYSANARYWLGELYLIEQRLEDAKASFQQVLERHPAHQKVPDSLYKLGVVHHRLGDVEQAISYFDDVVNRYPDTPAAGLARTYATELR